MFTKLIKNEIYTCGELYNCCSCGDNGCGCAYCYDCKACENCKNDNPENCVEYNYHH